MSDNRYQSNAPSYATDEIPLADSSVLEMISANSNANPDVDTYNDRRPSARREFSHADSSLEKSMAITETSPEPEPMAANNSGFDECDQEVLYSSQKYGKLKRLQIVYISLAIALGVAFLGTLGGLIAVVTARNSSSSQLSPQQATEFSSLDPFVDTHKPETYPFEPLSFPQISGHDRDIAPAFADYSLYESFYGVTYNGVSNKSLEIIGAKGKRAVLDKHQELDSYSDLQHQIALDIALLSRVTSRIRLTSNADQLIDRVIQVLRDLKINVKLALSVNVDDWPANRHDYFRVLNSYADNYVESIYVEPSETSSPAATAKVVAQLSQFVESRGHDSQIKVSVVDAQKRQANPLELGVNPSVAIEWLNSDLAHNVYTNLETPSETSDKAAYMTSWVCNVVPDLRPGIEWYWSNAFDDSLRGVENGIYTESRKMKPAGLPRCNKP